MMPGALILERFDRVSLHASEGLDGPSDLEDAGHRPFVTQQDEQKAEVEVEEEVDVVAALITRLSAVLDQIHAQGTAEINRIAVAMADTVSDAAQALLPSLAESHIAEEIASATLQIVLAAKRDDFCLALNPDDHDAVVEFLKRSDLPDPLSIAPDKTLAPGVARLTWDQGGAAIDKSALIASARAALDAGRKQFQPMSTHHE